MLEALYNETVTLRRATARDGRNEVTWAQVTDETGGALRLRGRLSRRARRIFGTDVSSQESDAQFVYKVGDSPELRDEDLIVTSRGEVWKILSIDREAHLGTGIEWGRASLRRHAREVPPDPVGN